MAEKTHVAKVHLVQVGTQAAWAKKMDRQDLNHLTLCCIVLLLKISLMYLCQVWLYDKILKIGKGMTYIYMGMRHMASRA